MTRGELISRCIRITKECDFYASIKNCIILKKRKSYHNLEPNSNIDLLHPYINKHLNNLLCICKSDPYNKLSMNEYGIDVTYKYCEIQQSENITLFILCSRILIDSGSFNRDEKIKMCYNYIFNG